MQATCFGAGTSGHQGYMCLRMPGHGEEVSCDGEASHDEVSDWHDSCHHGEVNEVEASAAGTCWRICRPYKTS